MVLLMLCLHLNSFAQHISMQLKNVTVKQAIETIQKQNGYSFTFAASDLNTQKIITVTARNLPIEKVVEQILIGQNVSYTSNPQLSSSASFLRLNVLSSLN